jgi:hypothetical protein
MDTILYLGIGGDIMEIIGFIIFIILMVRGIRSDRKLKKEGKKKEIHSVCHLISR